MDCRHTHTNPKRKRGVRDVGARDMNGASSLTLRVGVPRPSVKQCRTGRVQQLNLPRVDGHRGSQRRYARDESLDQYTL